MNKISTGIILCFFFSLILYASNKAEDDNDDYMFMLEANKEEAQNLLKEECMPKTVQNHKKRINEINEWRKTHNGKMPELTPKERYDIFIRKHMPFQ